MVMYGVQQRINATTILMVILSVLLRALSMLVMSERRNRILLPCVLLELSRVPLLLDFVNTKNKLRKVIKTYKCVA